MLKYMERSVWSVILLAFFAAGLKAQEYVYTNNDLYDSTNTNVVNSVSGFAVDAGTLGPIAGSPFATGPAGTVGTHGGLYSSNRIIVVGDFLYASNTGSNSISAFTIDSSTGALTLVGSPFATQGSNSSTLSGISLAATADGKYLYAGTTDGNITIYSIDSTTGALTPMTSGSPVSAGGATTSMKVTPNGKFLAVALYNSNKVAMFAIQSGGGLTPVSGSPFTANQGSGYITGIDINCAGTLLFAGRNGPDIDVFNINSDGTLSELTNSPFSTGSVSSNQVVALSVDDSTLFSSNQGYFSSGQYTVTAFPVGLDGSLGAPEATVGAGAGALYPGGLAVSGDGAFLYAADTAFTGGFGAISTFGLAGSTPLSFDSVISTGQLSGLHSLAAYPAKACAAPSPSNSLSITSLHIYTAPPLGFGLEATLSLGSSLAVDPLTQTVTIQIGDFVVTLPAGSFRLFQNGAKAGMYVSNKPVDGGHVKVQITPLGQNQFQISAFDKKTDLTGVGTSVTVTVGIGDNSASMSVTPTFGSRLQGNSRGQ